MSEPQRVWWCPVNEEWHGYACDDGDHDDENWHDKGDPPDVEHHAVRPEMLATLTRERDEAVRDLADANYWRKRHCEDAAACGAAHIIEFDRRQKAEADLASARTALAELGILVRWGAGIVSRLSERDGATLSIDADDWDDIKTFQATIRSLARIDALVAEDLEA